MFSATLTLKILLVASSAPVFMGVGLQDPVTPAPTNFAAYNQITASKKYRVYPFAGHGLPEEHYIEQIAWIRSQFSKKN